MVIFINELFPYALHFVNTSAPDNVKRIILSLYSSSEVTIAKKALWDACGEVLGKQLEPGQWNKLMTYFISWKR